MVSSTVELDSSCERRSSREHPTTLTTISPEPLRRERSLMKNNDRSGAIRDFSKAVAAFEHIGTDRAPEVDLSFARCLHNRAIGYANAGNKEAALSDINRAVDIASS